MPIQFSTLDSISGWYLLVAIFCVFLNAFFVAAEFFFVKISTPRVVTLPEEGGFIPRWALQIVHQLNNYLTACQLGITLASLGLGWLGEPAFARLLRPFFEAFQLRETTVHAVAFAVAFAVISILHLVLGELVPKQLAIQTAEKILLVVAVPMRLFYWAFYPLLWCLNHLTSGIVKILGFQPDQSEVAHSEEEIRLIVEDSYEEGSI